MPNVLYPLPLNPELARQVKEAARQTGLSQAELIRQALNFGLPKVVKALRKPSLRLTTVDPLPKEQAKRLYRHADDDRAQVSALIRAQHLQVES